MKLKVQKWGNSLAIRIPKSLEIEAKIKQNSVVDCLFVYDSIVARPSGGKPKYTLKKLLEGITAENVHGETEWSLAISDK